MMKKFKRVKDKKNLFRDEETNAIVNTNFDEYNNYLKKRQSRLKQEKKIDNVNYELEKIKTDIDEIKILLKNLVNSSIN